MDTQPLLDKGRPDGVTRTSIAKSSWPRGIGLALLCLSAAFVAIANTRQVYLSYTANETDTDEQDDSFHKDLYAMCSVDGQGIYTVDALDTAVECLVVNGAAVEFTGDRGEWVNGLLSR